MRTPSPSVKIKGAGLKLNTKYFIMPCHSLTGDSSDRNGSK